jgi:hypothetical protein
MNFEELHVGDLVKAVSVYDEVKTAVIFSRNETKNEISFLLTEDLQRGLWNPITTFPSFVAKIIGHIDLPSLISQEAAMVMSEQKKTEKQLSPLLDYEGGFTSYRVLDDGTKELRINILPYQPEKLLDSYFSNNTTGLFIPFHDEFTENNCFELRFTENETTKDAFLSCSVALMGDTVFSHTGRKELVTPLFRLTGGVDTSLRVLPSNLFKAAEPVLGTVVASNLIVEFRNAKDALKLKKYGAVSEQPGFYLSAEPYWKNASKKEADEEVTR